MDAIQIQDAVVGEKGTLTPGFKLLSQRLVEATDGTRTRGNSHERLSHLPNFVRTRATDKHLGLKLPLPISGDFEILNAPGGSHQIAGVGPIAIPTASGRAFSPGCSNALLQLFTHHLFDQNLDGTYGKAA